MKDSERRLAYHHCNETQRQPEYDARGIFLCFVCPRCRTIKLARYRPEVLTDPNYDALGERIEPDDD